ncbi:hypothetical protein [Domibacillus enclensis]|uniref:Uncharacterized protein n=1 Tax=Domibacillus enclensis TaxID=1017273 RepID=A0A1N6Y0J4_9BACI|nr:hypothetical protein [Domibacillus enclensis]OXS77476.1 hypothetical protein B1B05_11610 [Domibacillus enclensis]SIR08110.1 hypothetical protein SAMN05443094_105111 [Domibacillus enclensis]
MKNEKWKLVVLALAGSFLLHVSFYGLQFLYGYILTVLYVPDLSESWTNVQYLQNEVAFGVIATGIPWSLLFSYLAVAALCSGVIWIYWKRKMI